MVFADENCFTFKQIEFKNVVQEVDEIIGTNSIINDIVANNLIVDALSKNRIIRRIDNYDSEIYQFEWRIAFRFRFSGEEKKIESFHFLRQDKDKSWSGHSPDSVSDVYYCYNPAIYSMWDNKYNGEILYFAVSKFGD